MFVPNVPRLAGSPGTRTVNGRPDWKVVVPDNCQLLATNPSARDPASCLPVNGCHKYVNDKRCGMLKLDWLFSALRLSGSCAHRAVFNGVEVDVKLSSVVFEKVYAASSVSPCCNRARGASAVRDR